MLPLKFYVNAKGELARTDNDTVLRPDYSITFTGIDTTQQLRATVRDVRESETGDCTAFVTADDGCLCLDAVLTHYSDIIRAMRDGTDDGLIIVGTEHTGEAGEYVCDLTGTDIFGEYL